ncbi:hypothetical protein A2715_02420 [Candidatus Woesebacteria bacterium RIFCSPHIGHO2_01_FULL_39_32]|nr:MAG: hypothetical protein A2715_02420 [Candidatus Woesebacteria bacterium RIFCSPHIGHO2_01_FULL_39_32]
MKSGELWVVGGWLQLKLQKTYLRVAFTRKPFTHFFKSAYLSFLPAYWQAKFQNKRHPPFLFPKERKVGRVPPQLGS